MALDVFAGRVDVVIFAWATTRCLVGSAEAVTSSAQLWDRGWLRVKTHPRASCLVIWKASH